MQIKTTSQNLPHYKIYLHLIQSVESFLQEQGYLKLHLPVLSPALIPEGYLEVFETEFRFLDKKEKLYLTPSPELFIKRLLTEGIGDCYYLGPSFRNSEPNSPKHNPEFQMLELYKVDGNYMDIAQTVLELLSVFSFQLSGKNEIIYQDNKISFDSWEKMTVAEAFDQYANISIDELFDHQKFIHRAKDKGYKINEPTPSPSKEGIYKYEELFSQMYTQEIEPHLGMNGKPTLLYDYPVEFAALSKPNDDDKTAQRFEFYIAGVELGNCYSELTDWKFQEDRLQNEEESRKKQHKINHPSDMGFIEALKEGMPDCSGIAIGVERLAMIFANVESIDQLKLIDIK